jgi:hypothetical protein
LTDLTALSDLLRKYDLKQDDYRTGPSLRRETEARSQLALDLTLSSHVYAPQPFLKDAQQSDDDTFDAMSRATQGMSLADDVPTIKFGYLKPASRVTFYRDADGDAGSRTDDQPLGVRLLLQEWDIGTDPTLYEYYDPYGVDGAVPGISTLRSGVPKQARVAQAPKIQHVLPVAAVRQAPPPIFSASQPALPPAILPTTRGLPPRKTSNVNFAGSAFGLGQADAQSRSDAHAQPLSQLQEMASTQIVPGPFGGRPVSKKPAKKRMGGF